MIEPTTEECLAAMEREIADAITFHPGNRTGTPEQREAVSKPLAKAAVKVIAPVVTGLMAEVKWLRFDRQEIALRAERAERQRDELARLLNDEDALAERLRDLRAAAACDERDAEIDRLADGGDL